MDVLWESWRWEKEINMFHIVMSNKKRWRWCHTILKQFQVHEILMRIKILFCIQAGRQLEPSDQSVRQDQPGHQSASRRQLITEAPFRAAPAAPARINKHLVTQIAESYGQHQRCGESLKRPHYLNNNKNNSKAFDCQQLSRLDVPTLCSSPFWTDYWFKDGQAKH